ncbi:cytochrome b/b6 domain-containing protein [Ignatzschineria rhizosphaerae]|uniref:Cytochrome b/b6 domain-containing protein n=1 Tax=Ignatzschineria rhizosphaerae TaxID=2923279 RepID=A0ABY3X5M7_9GAMM|nr:cytochrome b/b6 domain-containing protein [Ignatzschineria rhizosphaerae]UNM96090.1 cytochrome b/b6 domain-containing protein [Ignatzschineria rhizosphaerae]
MIKVWDFPTRAFHWILVIAMAICVYTSYNLSERFNIPFSTSDMSALQLHQYAGTLILSLLIFRIIWGIVGATTARFTNFIKGPSQIIDYLKASKTSTEGHNPLGALMVIALILILLVQVITGLFLEDNSWAWGNAPLADKISGTTRGIMASLHTNGRAVLLWLIGIHIAAVFIYIMVKRQNLIKAMITGKRSQQNAHTKEAKSIQNDHPLLGMLIMAAIIAATFYYLF